MLLMLVKGSKRLFHIFSWSNDKFPLVIVQCACMHSSLLLPAYSNESSSSPRLSDHQQSPLAGLMADSSSSICICRISKSDLLEEYRSRDTRVNAGLATYSDQTKIICT